MNYNFLILLLLGTLGILLHNLVELNKLNKRYDGNVKIGKYLKMERFTIIISFVVVIVCIFIKQEIKQIEAAGNWLGLAFVAIGYMGQSLLVFVMGKSEKIIGKPSDEKQPENNSNTPA